MTTSILATKLYIPPRRSNAVSRPRLIDRLNQGLDGKLSLISAPAGFGKTTLVTEWLAQHPDRTIAWVSLDENDSEPVRFLTYLIAAVQTIHPKFGYGLIGSLNASQPPNLDILTRDLLNEWAQEPQPLVLVWDDYHAITDEATHQIVSTLIDYAPPQLHFVLTSRDIPPLALPRWRVRGQLTEIQASDLRFSTSETQLFLNQTMGLSLEEPAIKTIETRTEGWVAGLQLAAIALRGTQNADIFLDAFTGRDRRVADYLLSEVLERQTPETQQFLLQTSILPRFNASLCAALLAKEDQKLQIQQFLADLEATDLFIVPLDNERYWYRYHQLFAELLQNRLQQTWPAEKINALHLAASAWFENQGMIYEAIVQAFEAGAEETAAKLIEAIPENRLWQSDLSSMIPSWSQQLSKSTLANHPGVILYTAATQIMQGKIADLRRSLASMKQFAVLEAERMVLEAILIRNNGQLAEAFEMLQEAIERLPASADTIQDLANLQLAVCSTQLGDLDEAERYTNVIRTRHEATPANTSEISPIHLQAIQWQGYLVETRGELKRARSIYQAGLDRITGSGHTNPMSGLLYARLGGIHYQWNEIQPAQNYYDQAMTWGERTRITDILFGALFGLADLACYDRDTESLQDVIDQFNTFIQDANIPGIESQIAWTAAGYWLRMGELEKAVHWANESGLPLLTSPPYPIHEGFQTLIAVRVAESHALKSTEHLPQMLALVEQLIPQAETAQNRIQMIQDYLLKALILDGLSRGQAAVHALYQALELGQAGGHIRVYLDTGPLLHNLLQKALTYGEHITAIRRLLVAFAKEPYQKSGQIVEGKIVHTAPARTSDPDAVEPLIEPLTDRENEVLQLIASGLSNKAIQEQLFISNNTVRTHIKNLYSKLGVNNRTQAVLRAQDLGLA